MRGARRRPYVDMVKEGNNAADRPGRNPKGRGDLGASCLRSPLQYRHIAAGDPPKPASHIASVAHVPIYEIGSKSVPVPEIRTQITTGLPPDPLAASPHQPLSWVQAAAARKLGRMAHFAAGRVLSKRPAPAPFSRAPSRKCLGDRAVVWS